MGEQAAPTRRRVLQAAGATGVTGLLQAMTGRSAQGATGPWGEPVQPRAGVGNGSSVVILGAGIAGLTAAYLLSRAGYQCTVLEAQARVGGRSFTARRGDVITEQGPTGPLTQTCAFDEGLYLNLGPGRLPYHHRRALSYCNQLGVPLEPYIMETTANLVQHSAGFNEQAQVNRRVANDTRGYIAQLLAQAVNEGTFDRQLTPGEQKNLLDLLRSFGALQPDGRYTGSDRSGCAYPLTVRQSCVPLSPYPLGELLDSQFWTTNFYQPVDYEWQPTLFQPVGGMDRIVDGFMRQVGGLVRRTAIVQRITVSDTNVQVFGVWNNSPFQVTADFCISSIPVWLLAGLATNLAPDFRAAAATPKAAPTCKVGWQANTRFWESDKYEIYGGISRTNDIISQMWYPSNDYFTAKGTLTGAYNYSANALALGDMSFPDRLATAKAGGEKLHPEIGDEAIVPTRLGVSIAWQKVPYQFGGWADWLPNDPAHETAYRRLLAPDRRFYVTGDQVSPLPGWQEGAMMSAEYVYSQIAGRLPNAVPDGEVRVPDSRALTEGSY